MAYGDLVSVIIPSYNRENTIIDCLNSIANQTYENIEIIVVDDCSTDNTSALVTDYPDGRVKYYKLDRNMRACYARNYGFEKSCGKYIAFQDSDDKWYCDKLEKQLKFLCEKNYDVVFCGMNRIDEDGEKFFYPTQEVDTERNFYFQELNLNCMSTQTLLMTREVMESVKFDISFRRFQDWDFGIRLSKQYHIGYLPIALVNSTVQENSITATVSEYEALYHIYEKYIAEIKRERTINASFLSRLGDGCRKNDTKLATKYYRKSLLAHFSMKNLVKCIFSMFGIKY